MVAPDAGAGRDITDEERRAGMRWILWDGILASNMGALTGGVFLTGMALLLGAQETAIGLLSGLPRFSALMQPVGAYFVERFRLRKTISVWVFGPARILWLFVLVLPLLGYHGGPSRLGLTILSVVVAMSSIMAGFAAVSWLTWMAELIPAKTRGVYFGQRTMWAGGTSAVAGFLAGKFIDMWEAQHGPENAQGFLIVFAVALICGMASWYTLVRCPEPPIEGGTVRQEPPQYMRLLRETWSDRNFQIFLVQSFVLTLGVWIASPFFSVYMIKVLQMPYWLMGLLAAISSLGSLLTVQFWGRLTDHFGNRPVMLFCLLGVGAIPLMWAVSSRDMWWPAIPAHFVGGLSWAGVTLARMNLVFKITPDVHKSVYIGISSALDAFPALFAPLIGGYFLQHAGGLTAHIGGWELTSYHWLFLASGVMRLASIPLMRKVQEPKSRRVVHMIRVLSHFRSINPVLGLQYYFHVVSDATARRARRTRRAMRRAVIQMRRRERDRRRRKRLALMRRRARR